MPESWVRELREIHDSNFNDRSKWSKHVRDLNQRLGLKGQDEFGLPAPSLPPAWFEGNVEGLAMGEWVLAVSLNQKREAEDEPWHEAQRWFCQNSDNGVRSGATRGLDAPSSESGGRAMTTRSRAF